MAGVMSSVVMMTVVRNSQFAGLGAIILVVTVLGSVALLFSQRGKAQRTRRTQREAYLAYIEDLREEEPVGAHGDVDEVGAPFAEGLARMLAPSRLSAESLVDAPLSGPVDFAGLLGIDDVARLDLSRLWA
ncbi:hypothetical protein, partial [Streptomyces exfoliatus]|uniref:hypothetical protein n=1 Tax=Streptomyces exfoliatus TaxID=1905 RepID=UPI00200EFF88